MLTDTRPETTIRCAWCHAPAGEPCTVPATGRPLPARASHTTRHTDHAATQKPTTAQDPP
ncbi:hypothetical protein [Streptomyces sp. NPDC090026]|uniref:zinc finger domain-containing protein n=1 Tax=Streptomyces sp. NPDC090026 TaxID=3365923 RepID=UPI00381FC984